MIRQLRLYADRLEPGASASLSAGNREIHVARRAAVVDGYVDEFIEIWDSSMNRNKRTE